jgi:alkylated DNA nucleotide flippase Atl1
MRRPLRKAPPEECEEVYLRAGVGIDGDCHANHISPRQVLIVSTGAYDYCAVPPGSLRENILIRADCLSLTSGSLITLGDSATIRITFQCEPCGRLNKLRPGLSKDIRGKRGYLGRVMRSGIVRRGDSITVSPDVFSSFSDLWKERIFEIVRLLPTDGMISYGALADLAGVPKSFCRTFPRVLRSTSDISWHRVVASSELRMSNPLLDEHALGAAIFDIPKTKE